jgi:hypothetical protein
MDHYGIGAALKGCANIYFQSSRRSGRTVSLVESLRSGDRVIFNNEKEARRVKKMCAERNVNIDTITVTQNHHGVGIERIGKSDGRTIFDHSWVEKFYINKITEASKILDFLQDNLSSKKNAPDITKRKADEIEMWSY